MAVNISVVVRRWCCPTYTGSEASSCVGSVVEWLWRQVLCTFCGITCELPVDFDGQIENWIHKAQDGTVVGVICPTTTSKLCQLPAVSPACPSN